MVINNYENNISDKILLRKFTANNSSHVIQADTRVPYEKARALFSMQ